MDHIDCRHQERVHRALKGKADIFLQGGDVLNVYSGEILRMNVGIGGGLFRYVGPRSDTAGKDSLVLDVGGKVLVPGYIEPHCHPWLLYNPLTFAREAGRLGTTTFFCDNLIFYSLMGVDVFESFMTALMPMPVKFLWFCRAVPQTPMEREEEVFSVEKVRRLLRHPAVASLGEITRWQELLAGNPRILELIEAARTLHKRVDGHTAGAKYEKMNRIAACGVESCHESISAGEVLDRLRLGLHVMLRHSSLRQDLQELLRGVRDKGVLTDRLMLTTDASTPAFHEERGITDDLIRIAIQEGIPPVTAYRMVTLNPAVYFGLDHRIGGIAPGRDADILVLKDLLHPTPEMVISKGRIIGEGGAFLGEFPGIEWEGFLPRSRFSGRDWISHPSHFLIPSGDGEPLFPTIRLQSAVITCVERVPIPARDGVLTLSGREGVCFLALADREGGWVTNGLLQGMGDGIEGLASSFNTAMQILVIGRNPAAMSAAVNRVLALKGGIVAVEEGGIAYELPLPLGGMMSDESMDTLAEKERELKEFLSRRGYPFHDPLYTLVFLPNDFLPEVRINYRGVVDIKRGEVLWERRDLA
ncbi:MAG: adenine deaminase [Deltaproteobacteria bacterium]|nr:adenine deaminase [Deltaproteobacteria bacterium]